MDGENELKLAEEFAEICADLHNQEHEQPTLDRIVQVAVETIEACDLCGISLRTSGDRIETAASTGEVVDRADELQYRLGEGPCLESVWRMGTYLIEDLEHESRWPRWARAAAALGIGSVLSVQLETVDDSMGALNLYAYTPRAFDHTDLAMASIFARHASVLLDGTRKREGLRTALRSRQVIGAAQGILMQRYHLTLDQAFEVLRRYSQNHNTKVRTLAENLVRAGGVHDDGGSRGDKWDEGATTSVSFSALEDSMGITLASRPGPDTAEQ